MISQEMKSVIQSEIQSLQNELDNILVAEGYNSDSMNVLCLKSRIADMQYRIGEVSYEEFVMHVARHIAKNAEAALNNKGANQQMLNGSREYLDRLLDRLNGVRD